MCFYRPLLKLVDRLLLVGMLRDEDVEKLLIMIHPETWDPTFEKGNIQKFVHLHNPFLKFQLEKMNIEKDCCT